MKRRIALLFLFVAVMFGLSITALATSTIVFTGVVGSTDNVGGVYLGTLNGTTTDFECADNSHTIQPGESWSATTYSLSGLLSTPAVYDYVNAGHYNTANSSSLAQTWTMEAYLEYMQITGYRTGSLNNANLTAISYAIWSITGGSDVSNGNSSLVGTWISNAQTAWGNGTAATDGALVTFYLPVSGSASGYPSGSPNPQLFSSVTTPEPLSMALMGTFLTLAGLALGRKKLFSQLLVVFG